MSSKNTFICENNRKLIRLCTVWIFTLSGSFEDMDIFHVFQLSFDGEGGYIDP